MAQDATQPSPTVTTQTAWANLMRQLGGTNLQRARDARKAANLLAAYWKTH